MSSQNLLTKEYRRGTYVLRGLKYSPLQVNFKGNIFRLLLRT